MFLFEKWLELHRLCCLHKIIWIIEKKTGQFKNFPGAKSNDFEIRMVGIHCCRFPVAVTFTLYLQSLNIPTHIYIHSQKVINLVKSHNADAWHFAVRKVRPQSHYPTLHHNDIKYSFFILRFVKTTGKDSKPYFIYYTFLIFKVL